MYLESRTPFEGRFLELLRQPYGSSVSFVSNSKFESLFAESKGVKAFSRVTIRPMLPEAGSFNGEQRSVFWVAAKENEKRVDLARIAKNFGLQVESSGVHWGGPWGLRQFIGLLHIPYAPSTMSMYENLSVGLVYLIPSARFWLHLDVYVTPLHFQLEPWMLLLNSTRAILASEWYCPENQHLFLYFDSWVDLARIAKDTEMIKRQGEVVSKWAAKEQNYARNAWKKLFEPYQDG